jgi:DNA-binding response OmpR family regulator
MSTEPVATKLIAILDDEVALAELLIGCFQNEGWTTVWFSRKDDFLEAFPRVRPDLIVSDIASPGSVNGLDLLRIASGHPELKKIPIIMFTGWTDPKVIERALALGAAAYFTKPSDLGKVVEKIRGELQKASAI